MAEIRSKWINFETQGSVSKFFQKISKSKPNDPDHLGRDEPKDTPGPSGVTLMTGSCILIGSLYVSL